MTRTPDPDRPDAEPAAPVSREKAGPSWTGAAALAGAAIGSAALAGALLYASRRKEQAEKRRASPASGPETAPETD